MTRLRIVWDGDAPGLAAHHLSVGAFGPALSLLLTALRRTASAIVRQAIGDPDYGAKGGRLAKDAELLDLEIKELGEGSLDMVAVCTHPAPPSQSDLFGDLPDRTAAEVLASIEAESRGELRNVQVRKFLRSMPKGVTGQKYLRYKGDKLVQEVVIGEVKLADEASFDLPYLLEVRGDVVGVGFEPGRPEVRLRFGDRQVTCTATPSQVQAAIGLRGARVHALAVTRGNAPRLLWIREDGQPLPTRDVASLVERWDELLRRLSK